MSRGRAYYNEIDAYAAQWLRNLIAAGHIAAGDVDERSIVDVRSDDLRGYTQCHFFAGIGGWSYALRLAGWSDDRPVWTGSCPCQPFSAAGKQRGSDDERHLWPAFFRLIGERRPAAVFGEQVAGAAGLAWLDHVCADLEGAGCAAAAADLCAASVGAPHIRQRLYWVANAERWAAERQRFDVAAAARVAEDEAWERERVRLEPGAGCDAGALAHSDAPGLSEQRIGGLLDRERATQWHHADRCGADGLVADMQEHGRDQGRRPDQGARREEGRSRSAAGSASAAGVPDPWADLDWIECSDGKARPTQPGLFPLLSHGVSGRVAVGSAIGQADTTLSEEERAHRFNRVGALRGAGNAIVPQVAAAFVRALMEDT